MAWTAEDVAAQFAAVGADPTWNSGTAQLVDGTWTYTGSGATANEAARMQAIADRLNDPNSGYTSQDLQNSLAHILRSGSTGTTTTVPGTTPVTPTTPITNAFVDPKITRAEQRAELTLIYGWLPQPAIEIFIEQYIETGNYDAGWAAIRQDSRYEQWFPGNRTEDGRVRYSEEEYDRIIAAYDDTLVGVGLNPSVFKEQYGNLIRGEVSPYEFETERINPIYERIVSATDSIQAYYSQMYGINHLDTTSLIAAALDPDVGNMVLAGDLTKAELGGEALESGYNLTIQRVEELAAAGMNRAQANSLFTDAEQLVPIFDTLARRHNDPDDDFDIEEFISAEFFKDPAQNRRTRRMIAQERAMFAGGVSTRMSDTGSLTGLLPE